MSVPVPSPLLSLLPSTLSHSLSTACSGELLSEEQKQGGCSRLFIVTVMLVCAPSELVAPLKRDWSAAGEQALLDGRCAFQRTLYLDVAGEWRAGGGSCFLYVGPAGTGNAAAGE